MDRVEMVAQILCKIDRKNPDEKIQTGAMKEVQIEPNAVGVAFETKPQWNSYATEARRFVEVFDALQSNP